MTQHPIPPVGIDGPERRHPEGIKDSGLNRWLQPRRQQLIDQGINGRTTAQSSESVKDLAMVIPAPAGHSRRARAISSAAASGARKEEIWWAASARAGGGEFGSRSTAQRGLDVLSTDAAGVGQGPEVLPGAIE